MSTFDVEQLIAAWDERLKRIDENLIALEGEPTYQMLAGVAGERASLDGVTAQHVSPALDALNELFEYRERLTEVLDRAKEIKSSIGFFDKDDKRAQIQQLLTGPSIKVGTKPTPLAQRNLLDPAANDVAVVPERLLEGMVAAYQRARDVVMAVARAWANLEPFLEEAEKEHGALAKLAADLGQTNAVAAELASLGAEIGSLRTRVARDPLGATGTLTSALAPRLGALRQWLGEQAATRDRVENGLRNAAALEREVADTQAAADGAPARARAEILGVKLPSPADGELVLGLAPWRAKLEATARAGRWGPADVGLARWFETARAYLATDQAVLRTLGSLLEVRAELAGRLSARRAQLAALAARGMSFDPAMEEDARAADALLRRRPTALADAQIAVERFEGAVVALAAKGKRA